MKHNFFEKLMGIADRIGVYLLGFVAVVLNITLAFDNVVWGDEAYSQMAIINTDAYGVYQRVYYWDSHPPFYYYYLKFVADIFGYKTPVYHFASLIPFIIGIVFACTLIKKHLGTIPAIFFILISGFSESCVEYNLEIRMYSLVFMLVLLCLCYAFLIVKGESKTIYYVLMTLFGVLAAYTHYYGLALCGLIIFFAGLFNVIHEKRKKNKIRGTVISWILSTIIYIVVYIPWLFVLYAQTQAELSNSWMTEPAPFSQVLTFITGGARLKPVMLTVVVLMTIYIILDEFGVIPFGKKEEKKENRKFSADFICLLFMYIVIAGLLLFGYVVSYAFHPILAFRYTYVLIPPVLFIFMICVRRFVMIFFPESNGNFTDEKKKIPSPKFGKGATILGSGVTILLLLLVMILSLLDFKYFRSLTKTQDFQTNRVLETIGTPNPEAIMCANGVKHLAWSVLRYYYDNEVSSDNPNNITNDAPEFWAFVGYEYDDEVIADMEYRGYIVESYKDMWLGKYGINLYHFIRTW